MGAQESVAEKPSPQQLQRENQHDVRIVVAGCSYGTMAQHLINKFVSNEYREHYISNIGFDFEIKKRIIDDEIVRLLLFDQSPSLIFPGILRSHVQGSNVGLMVLYDVQDEESFERAREVTCEYKALKTPMVLVGCCCQDKEKRQVSYFTARKFADENNIPVVEVCGREGVNVELAFMTVVGEIMCLS